MKKKAEIQYGNVACMNCRWVQECVGGETCTHPACYKDEPWEYFDSYAGRLNKYPVKKEGFEGLCFNREGNCKHFELEQKSAVSG